MVLAQPFERLRQQVRDRARRRAEPHSPFQPLHLALNIVQRPLRIGQQPARALHQHLPYCRRPDLPALARQEWSANAGFEFSDMEADRWRRQMQRTRRIGKRAAVCNGDQSAQTVQADLSHVGVLIQKN
jgi:hypothetical protein